MASSGSDQYALTLMRRMYNHQLSRKEIVEQYNDITHNDSYDKHLLPPTQYGGPARVAESTADHFSDTDKATITILDVAAGTGKVGSELYQRGFRIIDALDPAEKMLNKAGKLGIYRNVLMQFIAGDSPVPCRDNTYDAVVCSGGFGEGHIPASAFLEFIRIVKPGGVVCFNIRKEFVKCRTEYVHSFNSMMKDLESTKRWRKVKEETYPGHCYNHDGILLKFKVL